MGLGVRPGAHPQNGGSAFYTPGVVSAEYIFIRGHTYSNFFSLCICAVHWWRPYNLTGDKKGFKNNLQQQAHTRRTLNLHKTSFNTHNIHPSFVRASHHITHVRKLPTGLCTVQYDSSKCCFIALF